MTDGEIIDALNAYFNIQYDNNRPVSYCDMAGAAGFDSITQLLNTARRRGGPVMRAISRCFLAVGAEYEDGGREGSKTALAMLSKLAEFDSQEDKSQAPSLPFSPRHELTLNVKGVQQEDNTLRNLTPQQAYIRVIRAKSIEEIPIQVSEEDDDSEVRVLDIEIDRF
jgi:hypothetical protein